MIDKLARFNNHQSPEISVVLPVFKAEATLARCLDSVLAQSFQDYEVICINDASPDGSQHIIEKYKRLDKRVHSLVNESNLGLGGSRNRGIQHARGRYVFHVDSDDTIPPDALRPLFQTVQDHDSDMVKGGYLRFRYSEDKGRLARQPTIELPLINTTLFETNDLLHATEGHWSYLYKTSFIRNVPYPEDLRMGTDSLFLVNALVRARKVSIINPVVYHYIHNPCSAMNTLSLGKALDMIEWRKRAWMILKTAGLNHLGEYLLTAYWDIKALEDLANKLSQNELFMFFAKFRATIQSLGIEQRTGTQATGVLGKLFALISQGKDAEANKLLVSIGNERKPYNRNSPKTTKQYEGAEIQFSRDKAPIIHWNNGEITSGNSLADYEVWFKTPARKILPTRNRADDPIKVLTICTSDSGGAGIGSLRRTTALRECGNDVKLLCLKVKTSEGFVGRLEPALVLAKNADQDEIWSLVRHNAMLRAMRKPDFRGKDTFSLTDNVVDFRQLKSIFDRFDILHLHMVVGMLDFEHIGEVLQNKPIVWTLADMNAFTGGCHYSDGCREFVRECRNCPQLGSESHIAHETWKIKNKAYKNLNLQFITPSKWLAEEARQSSLIGRQPIKVIHNPFPVEVLRPLVKSECRLQLGLPLDKKIILFGADAIGNKRKGGHLIQKALKIFASQNNARNIIVATFGQGKIDLELPMFNLGRISGDYKLAQAYSAADVFVLPSLEDNAPLTVGESLLCGTPVVGFSLGYLPEIIKHETTGYLAAANNPEDLAIGLAWAIKHASEHKNVSIKCRATAVKHHNPKLSGKKHSMLYQEIIQKQLAENTFYIVTPCLNAEDTIDMTIQSVISQAGDFSVRYNVQDRGSTDGTIEKLKRWEEVLSAKHQHTQCHRVEFSWSSRPDLGIFQAIDNGFNSWFVPSEAFMTWLSPGDFLIPGSLGKILLFVKENPKIQWLKGSLEATFNKQEKIVHVPIDGIQDENLQQAGIFFKMRLWFRGKHLLLNSNSQINVNYLGKIFREYADCYMTERILGNALPVISVITIVKNNEDKLPRAVESVLAQRFIEFEYIIVNDGSTDNTKKCIDDYAKKDQRVRPQHLPKNVGRSMARNTGLNLARGKYIFFLDSDDYIPESSLMDLYTVAEKESAEIVFGQFKCFDQLTENWLENHYTYNIINKEKHRFCLESHLELIDYHHIVGRLFRHELIKRNSIKFSTKRRNGEDVLFSFFTLYHAKKISMVPQRIVYFYSLGNYLSKANEAKLFDSRDNMLDIFNFSLMNGSGALKKRMRKKGAIFAGSLERVQKVYGTDEKKFKTYLTTLAPFVEGITDDILNTLPPYFKYFTKALLSYNFGEAYDFWVQRNTSIIKNKPKKIQRKNIDSRALTLKPGLDMSLEFQGGGYGSHRSGWKAVGMESLKALHNPEAVYFISFLEKIFVWGEPKPVFFPRPWIGFTHRPHNIPSFFPPEMQRLFYQNKYFADVLPSCCGIFTLSNYHAKHISEKLSVPVESLILPTEIPERQWDPLALSNTKKIKVVQVGWWLRKLHGIFMLPSGDYEKVYLTKRNVEKPVERLFSVEADHLKKKGIFKDSMYDTVTTVDFLPNDEYDSLLASCIIFLDLYDASANNAIVEGIARATPILVNPLEPIVEYLGKEYPLYYNSFEEAVEKLHNRDLLKTAHEYLKECPTRKKLSGKYFRKSLEESAIYKSIVSG